MGYLALDGYEVEAATPRAIGLRRRGAPVGRSLLWVPRSVVEDGDDILKGETDICVAAWFVEREGLIT
jgi:hypothetical protein